MQVEATQNTTTQPYYSVKSIETAIENVYAKRTPFSGTTNIIDVQNMQNILNGLSTNYSTVDNLQPTDISFEDYTKLNYSALEVLFNGDGSKVGPASGLMAKAKLTDDKTLNQIFFDKSVESKSKEKNDDFQDALMAIAPMKLKLDPNVGIFATDGTFHFKSNFTKSTSQLETEVSSKKTITTKEQLFLDFENLKSYYEKTNESQSRVFNMNKIFQTMNEIKALYEQKVKENSAILDNYTKNIKPNILRA